MMNHVVHHESAERGGAWHREDHLTAVLERPGREKLRVAHRRNRRPRRFDIGVELREQAGDRFGLPRPSISEVGDVEHGVFRDRIDPMWNVRHVTGQLAQAERLVVWFPRASGVRSSTRRVVPIS